MVNDQYHVIIIMYTIIKLSRMIIMIIIDHKHDHLCHNKQIRCLPGLPTGISPCLYNGGGTSRSAVRALHTLVGLAHFVPAQARVEMVRRETASYNHYIAYY